MLVAECMIQEYLRVCFAEVHDHDNLIETFPKCHMQRQKVVGVGGSDGVKNH